ncbi:MAG: DUF1801 domain-containing protein [Pseudomonadota bacterium]
MIADPVAERIASLPPARQDEAKALQALFADVTGWRPILWNTLIGYGRYAYTYASGHSGTFAATGFSPQKARQAVHILPGYTDFSAITDRLGPHEKGKSCIYIKRLTDIDEAVLAELIRAGLANLKSPYEVEPT